MLRKTPQTLNQRVVGSNPIAPTTILNNFNRLTFKTSGAFYDFCKTVRSKARKLLLSRRERTDVWTNHFSQLAVVTGRTRVVSFSHTPALTKVEDNPV